MLLGRSNRVLPSIVVQLPSGRISLVRYFLPFYPIQFDWYVFISQFYFFLHLYFLSSIFYQVIISWSFSATMIFRMINQNSSLIILYNSYSNVIVNMLYSLALIDRNLFPINNWIVRIFHSIGWRRLHSEMSYRSL